MNRDEIGQLTDAYKSVTVKHAKQEKAKERLSFIAEHGTSVDIVVLTGPTGSGKSKILELFAKEHLESKALTMGANPSVRPLAYTLATCSGHRAFDWKRLHRDTLRNADDPFAAIRDRCVSDRGPVNRFECESKSAALLREQVEWQFKSNGTTTWLIDEAQHVIRGRHSGTPGDQLDVLKSMAQTSGARLILSGTYDLPDYIAGSGQLSRRCEVVRLNSYRFRDRTELRVLGSVIQGLLKRLPSKPAFPDVMVNLEMFFVGCLGCVGIFKDWAARAYALSLQEESTTLTLEHFKRTRMHPKHLAVINHEIVKGEETYGDDDLDPSEELVRAVLRGAHHGGATRSEQGGSSCEENRPGPGRGREFRRPGTRRSTRDPAGAEQRP